MHRVRDRPRIFERYLWAGALTRNADALAETFTEDGVYEAPLVPPGHAFPRRLAGRAFDEDGGTTTMSLVQIFRVRDGKIALRRDYFAPEAVD